MPFSLAGLKAAGHSVAPGAVEESEGQSAVPPVVGGQTVIATLPAEARPETPPAIFKRPIDAAPRFTNPIAFSDGNRGFLKIFPPQFNTVAELPQEWIAANWSSPSPWCRIDGQPDHPDFEANLKAWETQ